MIIKQFDTQKGIYEFQLEQMETTFHAHPAIEFLYSPTAGMTIETLSSKITACSFIFINSNVTHRVVLHESAEVLMLECNTILLIEELHKWAIELAKNDVYVEKQCERGRELFEQLLEISHHKSLPKSKNERVLECLYHLNNDTLTYTNMLDTLSKKLHLSGSRISHLFKAEMGISLKKYMVWNRLKNAFIKVVAEEQNMYEAALSSGFYDQAHLSKAFKNMLGISPSEAYNSGMLQDKG